MSAATAPAKVTRNRAPSPFAPASKVTLSYHRDVAATAILDVTAITEVLTAKFAPLAVRVSSHSRTAKNGAKAKGPASIMVHVAPEGFKFAAVAERGVRLDSETADLLRALAVTMNLDPKDSASIIAVAKALATKAVAQTA